MSNFYIVLCVDTYNMQMKMFQEAVWRSRPNTAIVVIWRQTDRHLQKNSHKPRRVMRVVVVVAAVAKGFCTRPPETDGAGEEVEEDAVRRVMRGMVKVMQRKEV